MPSTATAKRILLITGKPGIGKTTLIRRVAAQLRHLCLRGFYTEEIRESGRRQGFRLITFDDEQAIIAHVNFDHSHRVGKYGVDVTAIDHLADSVIVLAEDIDLYVIDEIGKMECLSRSFVNRVQQLVESNKPIVATVAKKGGGLIEAVKHLPQSELWEITHTNRDSLPSRVVEWLQQRL
jgi:nucleoside-triphosphatase